MKLLLPSPSTSYSSSTTTATTTTTASFNANMCTSRSATASCLAGIFRRILCSCSLPTHPSDQITETSSMVCDHKHQQHFTNTSTDKLDAMATITVDAAAAPGVVARLMGLDSLPDCSSVEAGLTANSISRSRSMNCVELSSENDQMERKHRRVKSTLSIHEMPSFIEVENKEFFVLSFEYGDKGKEIRSKERKCEVGFKELKEKRRHKAKRKEKKVNLEKKEEKEEEIINKMVLRVLNEAELSNRISSGVGHGGKIEGFPVKDSTDNANVALQGAKRSNWAKHKEISDGAKVRRKKRNGCAVKDIEEPAECSSQESSPVSVLDFDQFIIDPEIPTSAEEDRKAGESNSRRRLRPELANHVHLSQHSDSNSIIDDRNSKKNEEMCCGSRQKMCHNNQDYTKLWSQICRLVETQVVESNWVNKKIWKFADFEDVSEDFGLQILDQLLEELVDQLA